nr:MAG TPA: Protein of unknown function (DUF551) [Caudoviricetes sp.]
MIDENKLIEKIESMQTPLDKNTSNGLLSFLLLDNFKDIVKKQPKVNEWIPVEERLPEENGYYIVTAPSCINEEMTTMELYFDDGKWLINEGDEIFYYEKSIIAWMPLPKPYEKEVKE